MKKIVAAMIAGAVASTSLVAIAADKKDEKKAAPAPKAEAKKDEKKK
jgi:serine protease inhibitor ecotin